MQYRLKQQHISPQRFSTYISENIYLALRLSTVIASRATNPKSTEKKCGNLLEEYESVEDADNERLL